jgi:hypothetical protein
MPERIPFFRAFAADARTQLEWLDRELIAASSAAPDHERLLSRLRDILSAAAGRLRDFEMLLSLNEPRLLPYMLVQMHSLELALGVVGKSYLPVLQRQSEGERLVRGLLFAAARASGILWIEDVAVRLDGTHAAFVSIPEIPIVYAPPRHEVSLVDMPGLYHELGHAAFARDSEIGRELAVTLRSFFVEQRRSGGVIDPGKRARRTSRLDEAEAYWTTPRLSELFCDVLATVVCGPAHYASFVDLALRVPENPFDVSSIGHPALAARVRACFGAMLLPHRTEPLVRVIRAAWTAHERMHPPEQTYETACSDALLETLVTACQECIRRHLPGAVAFRGALPQATAQLREDASFELVLNQAANVFFLEPDVFPEWQLRALDFCRRLAASECERRRAEHSSIDKGLLPFDTDRTTNRWGPLGTVGA